MKYRIAFVSAMTLLAVAVALTGFILVQAYLTIPESSHPKTERDFLIEQMQDYADKHWRTNGE